MREQKQKKFILPILYEAPFSVTIDKDSGQLWIDVTHEHPGAPDRVTYRAIFSPKAARQLLLNLKRAEDFFGEPVEDLSKQYSVQ